MAGLCSTGRSAWALTRGAATAGRLALVATTAYLDLLGVAAAVAHRRASREPAATSGRHRLAVLVPAHDEERLITSTVESLVGQDYPPDRVAIFVVADNCTDATADLARAAGADVHVRRDLANPGKGPALEWLLARIRATEEFDAFVFVDADTSAEPGFLTAIDRALSRGAAVVQGHYAVRDPAGSPVVAFRSAAFALRNYLRPLGRAAIGGTAGLYGNGMAFRADVMATRRWTDHLTEDAELALDLLVDGTLVAFAPDAKVVAEMPDTLATSDTQHERWERGRLQLTRRYLPALLQRSVTGGAAPRRAYADAALDQLVPPLSVVVAGTGAWAAASWLRSLVPGRRRRRVAGLVLLGQAAVVLESLKLTGAPRAVYRSLLGAPRMIAWKLALMLRIARRQDGGTWVRTARN